MPEEQVPSWSATVEAAYHSQSRELWALLYAQCNDADRAYDALQEAFVRLQAYNGPPLRDVRAWLLRVGRNWLRDVARHNRVAARSADFLDETAGNQTDPADIVARQELHAQVRAALDLLRVEDREILILRYALGWSSHRMAAALDLSSSAVDMRLSRARRRLGDLLEQAGVQHE